MESNETNDDCYYYNWGGDGTKERPSYPREYGAKCEYYDEFFRLYTGGVLKPNCDECPHCFVL